MTTDFRALCAELADALDAETRYISSASGQWITHPNVVTARAALADGPAAPQPPAEGEVAELVARLLDMQTVPTLEERRLAADLLQRLSPPQPVPVSEGLPRPKDCDAEGRCWWFALETEVDFGAWTLGTPEACTGDNWGHTHWLPAHALPVPEVES